MRKLKLQMHITLDGFVAGPEGQQDWMSPDVDEKQIELLSKMTDEMDTILMGRKMAKEFTSYWENVADNQPESPEYPYAKIFVDTPKIIFSKSFKSIEGKNTRVENGDLVSVVNDLKKQKGKDLIVYGGAHFVSSLIENNLIDELYLLINPVAIGKGLTIFNGRFNFKLKDALQCDNGVTINCYIPI